MDAQFRCGGPILPFKPSKFPPDNTKCGWFIAIGDFTWEQ